MNHESGVCRRHLQQAQGSEKLKGAKDLEKKISARDHRSNIWLISAHLSDLGTKTGNKCSYYISSVTLPNP